jgi:hypothetical protein
MTPVAPPIDPPSSCGDREAGLEGELQKALRSPKASFEACAALRHLRMRRIDGKTVLGGRRLT